MTDAPVTELDDAAAEQHQQVLRAAAIAWVARSVLDAHRAGMPITSARRWPRYLAMKARRGQQPISLEEAVHQCRAARAAP